MFKTRAFWPLIFMTIVLAGCQGSAPEPPAELVISGQVRTAAGDVPVLAHAHVGTPSFLGLRSSDTSVQVDADGSFELTVKRDGLAGQALALVALHHRPAIVPLVVSDDAERIELEMTLQAHPVTEGASVVRIEGDINADMEPRDDGTWVYTVEEPTGDTFSYRVRMGGMNVREIDGTQADRHDAETFGYYSVLDVPSGPLEIVFDPSQLPAKGENLPRLVTDHGALESAFNLKRAMDKAYEESKTAAMSGEKPDYAVTYAGARALAEPALASETSADLRGYAAVQVLRMQGVTASDLEQQALAQLPAESPFWSLLGFAVQGLDAARHGELLEQLRSHPDPNVGGFALVALVRGAQESGDQELWNQLYAELEAAAETSPVLGSMLSHLDPDPRIAVGKPVPDFELALFAGSFNGKDTVSNADLLGRVYLIDFWGTWCAPCVEEIPKIRKTFENHQDQGFEVLSVAYENSLEVVRDFMEKKEPMPWLHHYVKQDYKSQPELLKAFEVNSYPKPLLVGADGTILATETQLRGEELITTVAAAFEE